jgi:WD40 repeat protein
VRIFDVSKRDEALLTLKGHSARVFNVAWNPLFESILASGSDDKSIRVWDIRTVFYI